MRLCHFVNSWANDQRLLQGPSPNWIFHSPGWTRRWRSLTASRRRVILAVSLQILLVILLVYNVLTSEFHLIKMKPRVEIAQSIRSRCCTTTDGNLDMCGRTDCLSPCPVSVSSAHDRVINQQEDKAFFHETSGASTLNFRQACVVESLANRNPNLTIHLLMTGSNGSDLNSITLATLKKFYGNLHVTDINLGDYVAGTPLERWYFCSDWNRGWFAISHLSDALRFLTLSKFGGYYFDLDVIQLRPVTRYRNFVVAEDGDKLGSSVIHVDYQHPVIRAAVEQFPVDYKWYVWAHNGPDLMTRVLQNWCNVYYISWMTPERCKGFRILPPKSFYPVHYLNWRAYFYARGNEEKDRIHWDDSVIGAHVWNSFSSKWVVNKDSNQYYAQMARSSCPRIFQVSPDQF